MSQSQSTSVSPKSYFTVFPNKTKQTITGIGFEIQSDSIGSGNHGLPEEPVSVPHDLVLAERERLANEMLKGFRYCRLAGGLYWRGLDPEKKFLKPRWPEQLQQLKALFDTAGVEGISLEYWSPAPFWKANQAYYATPGDEGRVLNRLRCFAPGFDKDPLYKGDTDRFLADFANAVVTDIQTLKAAGLKTSMFGLQNEPNHSNPIYPSCEYINSADYVTAFVPVAKAIRKHDPNIFILADTHPDFPKLIGPAMKDPEVASLVDAYAVHTIGSESDSVRDVHERITKELPLRPWFQNEYEYLRGGSTPDRCLNTVQHIMNSFQLAENPTWFWIHVLKPFGNAEADGYSLGFWKSLIEKPANASAEQFRRWVEGPEFIKLPEKLKKLEMVSPRLAPGNSPARHYCFIVNQPVTVYLLAEDCDGLCLDPAWEKTEMTALWENGKDVVFKCQFPAGDISVPAHGGRLGNRPAAPHIAFVEPSDESTFRAQIGVNVPIQIRSEALVLERKAAAIQPGHWIFNPYNWHAVGSFVKHMPWDSVALEVEESKYDPNARILAFKRPDGKLTLVVSNRNIDAEHLFEIATALGTATWKGFRYTPADAGESTMGVPLGIQTSPTLKLSLPPQSWEFWEQE